MVEEIKFKGRIVFKCMKCGYLYRTKDKAIECEEWCMRSKSCNLNITKYAIKMR